MLSSYFKVYFSILTSDRFSILDIREDYVESDFYKDGAREKCKEKYKHLGKVIVYSAFPINRKYDRLLVFNDKIDKSKIYTLLSPQEIEQLRFDDLSTEQQEDILENGNIDYFISRGIINFME